MSDIAIVTDSSAGIPNSLIEKLKLHIVPIGVQIDNKFYREGIDLLREELYAKLDSARSISTSQPSPGDFLEVYHRAAKKAREIISIHVTSKGSGTVNTANLVKDKLQTPITVIDSQTAAMAQGFMAIAAAQAAQLGLNKEEILATIQRVREQTAIFVAVPTLKYLEKSGRVSSVKRLIASVLSIKPILGVKEGMVDVVDQTRSYPRALGRVIDLVEKRFTPDKLQLVVMHSNAKAEAAKFKELIEQRFENAKIMLAEMGASLAVHGGRGMLGIAAYNGTDLQI